VVDQLSAQLFRGQSRVQPPRPKPRVRLTESPGDILNIGKQLRQMLLGTQSASGAKGVATGNARSEFVHPFANRDAVPPELLLSPPLSAASQGAHGPCHEQPTLHSAQRFPRFDNVVCEPIREFHELAPSTWKKHHTSHCRNLGYLFVSGSLIDRSDVWIVTVEANDAANLLSEFSAKLKLSH
jgi:hypothetical protein